MEIEIFASGLLFPEGPVVMDDGSLLVVEIARGTLSRICDGHAEVVAELGGGPNGAALGPDGKVYVCNNGGRFEFIERDGLLFPGTLPESHDGGSVQRVDPASGQFELLYEACQGRRLKAPNDLVFDRHGGFWFTDHGTNRSDGAVYYAKADGSQIHCWRDGLMSPNGVGLSPDERTVYFADTSLRQLFALELTSPGELPDDHHRHSGMMFELPQGHLFDSLAVEAEGTVCVATLINGGITAWKPDGSWEHVRMPDAMTTNICFGGENMRDAYITLSSSGCIAKARWPRPGLRLNHQG